MKSAFPDFTSSTCPAIGRYPRSAKIVFSISTVSSLALKTATVLTACSGMWPRGTLYHLELRLRGRRISSTLEEEVPVIGSVTRSQDDRTDAQIGHRGTTMSLSDQRDVAGDLRFVVRRRRTFAGRTRRAPGDVWWHEPSWKPKRSGSTSQDDVRSSTWPHPDTRNPAGSTNETSPAHPAPHAGQGTLQ